ncbi:MAG: NUDIX domain-containing protein [Bacteroidetes bacterium]|nr:NUDIX domain-containing protein [Bacteroidota bacterium]
MSHNRKQTRIASVLIGTKENKILLQKRINTGYADGHWSLVAGHVDEGESASKAMIREAYEECGLILAPEEISHIGVVHHFSKPHDYIGRIASTL